MNDDIKLYQDAFILAWLVLHKIEREKEQEIGTIIGRCKEVTGKDDYNIGYSFYDLNNCFSG